MNERRPEQSEHIAEGDFVRYLDDEVTVTERAHLAAHLIGCAQCSRELESLRTERRHFEDLLASIEIPPIDPARRSASLAQIVQAERFRSNRTSRVYRIASLRAAAVVGVLVAGALATSPVRAWVVELWRGVTSQVERLAGIEAVAPQSESISLSNATVGFVPAGPDFVIEVRSHQSQGTLVLGVGEGVSVSARAVGDSGTVDLVVLESAMRIQNAPEDRADYAVSLPAHLREVRVRIAGAPDVVYRMSDLTASWISVVSLVSEAGPAEPVREP